MNQIIYKCFISNIAILIFIGGIIGWLIGIPLLVQDNMIGLNLVDRAYDIWSSDIRYIGVGSMVVGGIASIFKVRHGLIDAINRYLGLSEEDIELITNNALKTSKKFKREEITKEIYDYFFNT